MSQKQYLLGRQEDGRDGRLYIGRYMALDGSTGAGVFLDVLKPHAVVICGKRGYGKSHTMGVLAEEFARMPSRLRENFSVIVIDTMGIFSRMALPSTRPVPGQLGTEAFRPGCQSFCSGAIP